MYNQYRKMKPKLVKMYETDGERRASELAVTSFIPLLALYTYLTEEGYDFTDKLKSLREFYEGT